MWYYRTCGKEGRTVHKVGILVRIRGVYGGARFEIVGVGLPRDWGSQRHSG